MRYLCTILLILLGLSTVKAQSRNIVFYRSSLQEVLKRADQENKHVFIDTYASWCKPCKRMEEVFRNKDVATYFNKNFINYRVNMESGPEAEYMKSEFSVVFLPTMIILDPRGNVEFQHDKEMAAEELLIAAKKAINPTSYYNTLKKSDKEEREFTKQKKGDRSVDYTYESEQSDEFTMLREEAYFRKSLRDGSHKKAAIDYMNTQKDWNTPANMKFILDFTEETNTKFFNHIIKNRYLFDKEFGKEEVEKVLNVVIYNRLKNGFPRPSLNEAHRLYKKIKVDDAYAFANNYFINRLLQDGEHKKMLSVSREYLRRRPGDASIAYIISSFIYNHWGDFMLSDRDFGKKLAQDLFKYDPSDINYAALQMKYLILGHRCLSAGEVLKKYDKQPNHTERGKTRLLSLLSTCK